MANIDLKAIGAKIGSYALVLAFFAGIILLSVFMIWGAIKVSAFLYPFFAVLGSAALIVFLLIIIPLSLFSRLRPLLANVALILSWVCGATVWMFSFLIIMEYLSFWAFLLFFIFQFVAPIAAIGLFIKGQWVAGGSIVFGLFVTYGMRFYAVWLATSCERVLNNETYVISDPVDNKLPRYCPKCGKTYDDSWKVCLHCSENLLENTGRAKEAIQ